MVYGGMCVDVDLEINLRTAFGAAARPGLPGLAIEITTRGGSAGTCTQLARGLAALQTGSVSTPSTLPWGDRPDLHRLRRGSRPRAASTLASTTVRLEGFAPPTTRLSSELSAVELQAGIRRTRGERRTGQTVGFEPTPLEPNSITLINGPFADKKRKGS